MAPDLRREIGFERLFERGIVWRGAGDECVCVRQIDLGVGDELGQLRAGEAAAAGAQRGKLLRAWQALNGAREFAGGFEALHEAFVAVEIGAGASLRERERESLVVIIFQHQARDIVGHARQQFVALFGFQSA